MKKLALAIAIGAATLLGGTAVNAADTEAKPAGTFTTNSAADTAQATDVSSRHRRHWRHHRHWHRHGWHPHYRSYGYYPGYYAPRYYAPAPVISFGFGPRFHHRHWNHW